MIFRPLFKIYGFAIDENNQNTQEQPRKNSEQETARLNETVSAAIVFPNTQLLRVTQKLSEYLLYNYCSRSTPSL